MELISSNNGSIRANMIVSVLEHRQIKGFIYGNDINYELNSEAHPDLERHKEEIYQFGETNKKMYYYVFD